MLDPRLYRVAFVPVLLALLVAAFSLQDRPRPDRDDAGAGGVRRDPGRARRSTTSRARFPVRRPGDAADDAAARRESRAAARGRCPGTVERAPLPGRDDRRQARPRRRRRHAAGRARARDRRRRPPRRRRARRARRAVGDRRAAGARARRGRRAPAADHHLHLDHAAAAAASPAPRGGAAARPSRADAVIVLGDRRRRDDAAAVRRRAVQRPRAGADAAAAHGAGARCAPRSGPTPARPRALTQWLRMAVPADDLRAGRRSCARASPRCCCRPRGERPPAAGAPVSRGRLQALRPRRAARRSTRWTTSATSPRRRATTSSSAARCCPAGRSGCSSARCCCRRCWGDRRARAAAPPPRADRAVAASGRWPAALPFLLACLFARAAGARRADLRRAGAPIPRAGARARRRAVAALRRDRCSSSRSAGSSRAPRCCARAGARVAGGARRRRARRSPSALSTVVVAARSGSATPTRRRSLVPAVHLWLLGAGAGRCAAAARRRWRSCALGAGAAGARRGSSTRARSASDLPHGVWFWTLLVAGGHVPIGSWVLWSLLWGCAVAAALVAVRRRRPEDDEPDEITVRGPVTYAGPGSLGGTGVGPAPLADGDARAPARPLRAPRAGLLRALSTVLIAAGAARSPTPRLTLALAGAAHRAADHGAPARAARRPAAPRGRRARRRWRRARWPAWATSGGGSRFLARSLQRRTAPGDAIGRLKIPRLGARLRDGQGL